MKAEQSRQAGNERDWWQHVPHDPEDFMDS